MHRGVHALGEEATQLYDAARLEARGSSAPAPDEIVFVRGTTEAINLVAHAMSLGREDEVVFPASEHHANWLPWRVTRAARADAHRRRRRPALGDARVAPHAEDEARRRSATCRTSPGASRPVDEVVRIAHARGIPVLLDAAQSLSHLPIDVKKLDVDFLAASSHKAFGPSGVGMLYAKRERLADVPALPGGRRHGRA